MIKNNGKKTNEEAFWDFFCSIYGTDARKDEPIFEEFYKTEFQKVKSVCGFDSNSAKIVHKLKNSGIRVVCKASNKRDLEPLNKCRGENKALQTIVQHLKAFGFKNGKVRIAHCFNEKAGKALKELLQAEFNKAQIKVCRCRGLCSFYAEKGGLLVGYEAK